MRLHALEVAQRVRAVELLAEGNSYDEIAQAVGFTNRGSAHRAVSKALTERQAEDVDLLRAVEGSRLDRLQLELWDQVLAGDHAAALLVLRIIDQRCRLFGLYVTTGKSAEVPAYLVRNGS